jgi:hypothetical protein
LGNRSRDRQHGNADPGSAYFFDQFSGVLNDEIAYLFPDDRRIVIEDHGHAKAVVGKPLVTCKGVSKVTRTDQYHVPDGGDMQDRL